MHPSLLLLLYVLTASVAGAASGAGFPPLRGATVATGAPRDVGPPPPARAGPLPFYYDLYTFRGPAGSTAVVAAFAVPAGRLRREHVGGEVQYRFDVTLEVADTALRTVYRTDDSAYIRLPRTPAREHLLYTHIAVQAPPSGNTLQRVIMTDASTPGVGQLYTSSFPIPDYGGSDLMLSDIALAQPDTDAGWRRGGVELALLPTSQFPGSAFEVYYEIYNLPAGHAYRTEIAVEPADGTAGHGPPDGGAVRVHYSGEAETDADGLLQELRFVEASVGPGRYRITITVTDEDSGETASRSRIFRVSGLDRGATLAPAWPRGERHARVPGR